MTRQGNGMQMFPYNNFFTNVNLLCILWPACQSPQGYGLPHTWLTSMKRFTNLNLDYASRTLAVPKMKSYFHTENKKCLGSKLNFVFYTCLPNITLGLTLGKDVCDAIAQVYPKFIKNFTHNFFLNLLGIRSLIQNE